MCGTLLVAQGSQTISTTTQATNTSGFLAMQWGVTAANSMTIWRVGMQANAGTRGVEVWYRPGGMTTTVPGGWTLAGRLTSHTFVAGINQIPIDLNVNIPTGQTYGIAVIYNVGSSFGYNTAPNPQTVSNADLTLNLMGWRAGTYNVNNNPAVTSWTTSSNATTNLTVWYDPPGPYISTSVTTLALGTTNAGTAGSTQSYTVSGDQTTAVTDISAPTGVEVSLNQSTWGQTAQITTTGTWGPTTVYARISAGASQGSITGNIAHTSTGLTTKNVSVSGTVTGPNISTSVSTLALGTAAVGNPGTTQTYTVSGFQTTAVTDISAPTGVEVSLNQSTWGQTAQITTTGTWGPTTVYARISASASQGAITGNIVHTSTGLTTQNISVSGTVNAGGVIYPLNQQDPVAAAFTLNASTTNAIRGYRFQCNTNNVTVTSLGCYYPVATTGPFTITISLWNFTTQALLGQVTTTTQGQWVFVNLTTPVALTNSAQYIVSAHQNAGGYYYKNFTPPSSWLPTGDIQYLDMRHTTNANPNTFPTSILTNYQYGVVDFGYTTGPALSTSTNSLNLGTTPQGTAGTEMSYTVSGSATTNQTVITAPASVEISQTSGSGYTNSITIASTGNWGPVTIYARIMASASGGAVSGNITHVSTGASSANVAVNGTVTGPTIITSTATLNLGSTYETFPSTPVSYTVSGSILTNQTVITAPANVEISLTSGSGYTNSITIAQTGTWGPTTIYARIAASAAVGSVSGNITHVSSGAATQNVAVSGTVNPPSVVPSNAGPLDLGTVAAGNPGTEDSYTISGFGTRADTIITAPAGVEVSFSQATGYANSITVTTQGSWGPTTIYARISASAAPGAISGNITHATTGASTANVSVTGQVIDLQATPTSLNLGNTSLGTPGTPQSYNLTGSGLSGNTTINVTSGDIEISLSQAGTFGSSVGPLSGATVVQDIWVRLTGAALGAVNGTVTNSNSGVDVIVTITGNVTPPDDLGITRHGPNSSTSVNNDDQGPGGDGLVILDFEMGTNQAAWTVTDITFSESGTADGMTDISFIALYEDNAGAGTPGTFDGPATDTLATAAAGAGFSAADGDYVATLNNGAFAASIVRRFFLVVKLAGLASPLETIQAEVTAVNAATGGTGSVTGVPTSAANSALDILPATLTANFNDPSAYTTVNSDSQGPGNNGHVILDVTLDVSNDSWTVTSLTFTASGTADEQADISFLAVYVDNGNGTFDGPATDTLATAAAGTSFNAPNGTYTATLNAAAGAFTMNASKQLFLVAKLAGSATSGETFRAALTGMVESSPSGGTVTGVPSTVSSALVIDVATLSVNAATANPADAYVEFTSTAFTHTLACLRLSASNDNFTLSGVTLTLGGNGDWVNNVTQLRVYNDDGNAILDAGDTQLFAGSPGVSAINCAFSTNLVVTNGTHEDLWVVIDVAATAGGSPSETFTAEIASAADVQQVGAGNVLIGSLTPISGVLHVIVFAVTSFTPVQDVFAGGATITITGSGFATPITCTINGVPCTGTAVADATGTTITGLRVPQGSGSNLTIVLTTNNLGPKTLTQTFSYQGGVTKGGNGGGGGGGGCASSATGGVAWLLAAAGLLALRAARRRSARR
jgi:hypothetical protein